MDTHSTRHLGQAYDACLKFTWVGLHDIGELVDNDDNVRHSFWHLGILLASWLDHCVVVRLNITYLCFFEYVVAAIHFLCSPLEREDTFLRIGNNWGEEVGNTVIEGKLHTLRVHHDEAHLVRTVAVQEGSDKRVNGH